MLRFIKGALVALVLSITAFAVPSQAEDLVGKSTMQMASEVGGIGKPDAGFVLASAENPSLNVVQIADMSGIGDQSGSQVFERSTYCSSGCSSGCSMGCSSGCSSGCSVGCSVGCRPGW